MIHSHPFHIRCGRSLFLRQLCSILTSVLLIPLLLHGFGLGLQVDPLSVRFVLAKGLRFELWIIYLFFSINRQSNEIQKAAVDLCRVYFKQQLLVLLLLLYIVSTDDHSSAYFSLNYRKSVVSQVMMK